MIRYFRALFPTWNFFDRIASDFELQFRTNKNGPWMIVSFQQKRSLLNLIINPDVNLALAQVNMIEHFVQELPELGSSFEMIKSLLQTRFQVTGPMQFKILACTPNEKTDHYVSEWIVLNS